MDDERETLTNAQAERAALLDDETLGPCGCRDYHLADCPIRTGYADSLRDPSDDYDPYEY